MNNMRAGTEIVNPCITCFVNRDLGQMHFSRNFYSFQPFCGVVSSDGFFFETTMSGTRVVVVITTEQVYLSKSTSRFTTLILRSFITEPFKRQSHKLVKHTQTILRHFPDELFECV